MKAGKLHGIEHRIRELRKKEQNIGTIVAVALLIGLMLISVFVVNSLLGQPFNDQPSSLTSALKAAIVDQLSLTFPNETFVETATNILEQSGYTVDYYAGEKVTVQLYRNLSTYGYRLIVFRVHSCKDGAFFTSNPYSTSSYVEMQLCDQLWLVSYDGNPPYYFGISSSFVKSCMIGRFDGATIIAMGCYGLMFNDMAEAFIEKGAKFYIGWRDSVLASYTDAATTYLLEHLLAENQTIRKAINQTMEEIGSAPALLAFPEELGSAQIPDSGRSDETWHLRPGPQPN